MIQFINTILSLTLFGCVFGFEVKKGYFWQVTDFHYDANYSIHGNPNSMCHEGRDRRFNNSMYGNYLCDAPWLLVESAINAMKKIHPDPDFILWTGDSIPHVDDSKLDMNKVYENIGNISLALHSVFPNTTVYPVLGNHDEHPSNHFPDKKRAEYYAHILNISHWNLFLDASTSEDFKAGGYYKAMTDTGLMILGLNTNLYVNLDPLTRNSVDPADQFDWLQRQLQQAMISNIKVLLVAHVPPGYFERSRSLMWFYPKFNERFVQILRRHSNAIAAQIYGHEHTDSFRILKDSAGRPNSILFLSPAVTPWKSTLSGVGANNPGIRLYQYNQLNGVILDYTQYYLNLSAINRGAPPTWQVEYMTKQEYNLKSLRPEVVMDLAKSFDKNMTDIFKKYLIHNSVSQELSPLCDDACVKTQFCSITELQENDFKNCLKPPVTHTPRHHTTFTPKPVPRYMEYIIIGLGVLVFALFLVIAVICIKKRSRFLPHKYSRFSTSVGGGPIN